MQPISNRTVIIGSALALLTAFAAGRYTAQARVVTETKIVEVEKKTDDKKVDTNDHRKATIVETTSPDGTKTKTTTITDDRNTKSDDRSTDDTKRTEDDKKSITKGSSPVTVSVLASMDISAPGLPVYGLAVSRPILGPITLGIFGFQNKTGGLSIGLTF